MRQNYRAYARALAISENRKAETAKMMSLGMMTTLTAFVIVNLIFMLIG